MAKPIIEIEGKKPGENLVITATVKGKTAYLSIDGHIHEWADASARTFKRSIKELKKDGAMNAEIYINSRGGSCFEANEMTNIIKKTFGADNVNIEVGALAASAATYFLAVFNKGKRTAKKNSQFMIHKPMAGMQGNSDEIRAQLRLLDNLEDDYRKTYAAAFSKTEDEITDLWKQDYWMNASQALKLGLISEIEDAEEDIDASTRLQLVACGAPTIPQVSAQQPNELNKDTHMNKEVLAAKLGLPTDATDAQITAALDAQAQKATTADELQKQLDQQTEEANATRINALLDTAEQQKKITPEMRKNFEKLAESDFAQVEAIIKGLTPLEKIQVDASAPVAAAAGTEDPTKKDWTYADYAENDVEAFYALPEAKQQELLDAEREN